MAPLNYRYDDEAPTTPTVVPPQLAMREDRPPMDATSPEPASVVAETRYEVSSRPLTVSLQLRPTMRASLSGALAAPGGVAGSGTRLLLVVEGIVFEGGASGVVEVYLNAPEPGEGGQPAPGHAVGTFTYFAGDHPSIPAPAHPGGGGGHGGRPPRLSRTFDITQMARSLQAAGRWEEGEVRVTLVLRPLDPDEPLVGKVSFTRAELRLAPGP